MDFIGFVGNIIDVSNVIRKYEDVTTTTFIHRRSDKDFGKSEGIHQCVHVLKHQYGLVFLVLPSYKFTIYQE